MVYKYRDGLTGLPLGIYRGLTPGTIYIGLTPGTIYSPCPSCGLLVGCGFSACTRGLCCVDGWSGSPFRLPLFACSCGAHWAGEE